jgi:predicted glycosyltransferase
VNAPRVLFHVQHLLGIGHLQRAAAIAAAMQGQGLSVTVVSGGEPVAGLDFGGAELVQLPPAFAADTAFSAILDAGGRPIDEAWKAARCAQLLSLFERLSPDVLLLELYPFGRRLFGFELLPLLEAGQRRARRPAVAVSVRDILVESGPEKAARAAALVERFVDRVLVHGDPRLVGFEATFPATARIAGRLTYTGYVVGGSAAPPLSGPADEGGEVLVSTGGGVVGGPLLEAALAARPLSRLAGARWRLIAGPNLPADRYQSIKALAAAAGNITLERFRADFRQLLARCRLSLSQAGYNTVMDVLSVGARAVVVPFADGKENEQTLRARLLAERGWLTLAPDLAPEALAAAIDGALDRPRPAVGALDMDGASRSAAVVAELADAARAGRLPPPQVVA